MAVVLNVKKELIKKISALSSVQKVYGWEHNNPEGFPSVMVIPVAEEGSFSSNAENRRVYRFNATVLHSIGQDLEGQAANNRMEEAERIVPEVVEDILDTIETDYELGGYAQVLFVRALSVEYSYVIYDGGWAKSAVITIEIETEFNVQTGQPSS